jgi:hypothetical protein
MIHPPGPCAIISHLIDFSKIPINPTSQLHPVVNCVFVPDGCIFEGVLPFNDLTWSH